LHKRIAKTYKTTLKPPKICSNLPLLYNYPKKLMLMKHIKTTQKTSRKTNSIIFNFSKCPAWQNAVRHEKR